VVAYRSWQAGIRLTDEGAKVAAHLMPAGTQLEMLLEPFIRWRQKRSRLGSAWSWICSNTIDDLGYW